jgi:prepilin-type N-terminal cleavage/methylation domain-containing protein
MRVKSQKRRVEGRKSGGTLRAHSGSCRSSLDFRRPPTGVTLIELMIVMLIISILAALVLGVAAVAAETARQAQTRHVVERMHTLLLEYYDTYKTRRVKLRESDTNTQNGIEARVNKNITNPAVRGQALSEARLYALREMMLMEVPDRWSDVLLKDVGTAGLGADDAAAPQPASSAKFPIYLANSAGQAGRTDLANVYLRRYSSLVGRINALTGKPNTAGDIKNNQGAECLYMVITLACGDGEAKTLFAEKDIGDTDGDGAPEFLDGWGHPISFLRWAPGFESQIQLNAVDLAKMNASDRRAVIAKDHDPFDIFRADTNAFRLVPLIYSTGRDETSGINDDPSFVTWLPQSTLGAGVNSSSPFWFPRLTPYEKKATNSAGPTEYLGITSGEGDTDNVHNHLMGQR